jgi:hypothetical protein
VANPAAQKLISAAQTRIEIQRFFDILGVLCGPKSLYFWKKISSSGPETNLGWPPQVLKYFYFGASWTSSF